MGDRWTNYVEEGWGSIYVESFQCIIKHPTHFVFIDDGIYKNIRCFEDKKLASLTSNFFVDFTQS